MHPLPCEERHAARRLVALGAPRVDETVQREAHAQAEFLARMGHELRTPLNAIVGFTKLLQREAVARWPDEQCRQLEHVRIAGDYLLSLVNAMLDLSWLEAGGMLFDMQPIELDGLVRQVSTMLEPIAGEREVRLGKPPLLVGVVHADAMRLRQVLVNLLGNAIKYNRPGGEVCVETRPDAAGITLIVRDNGQGMTPAQLQHLFEPFNRLGRERSKIEGTGLGLVVSKALVEHMGGHITVSSTPDAGSAFAVWLPLAAPEAAHRPMPAAA